MGNSCTVGEVGTRRSAKPLRAGSIPVPCSNLMKKETVFTLDYREFDELVKKNYPTLPSDWTIVADQELRNDSTWKCGAGISPEALDDYDREQIANGEGWIAPRILQDLVNKKVLEPGTYLIEISW